MKRFLPVVVLMALVWAGCGGKKSSTSTTVAVTISPTTASIAGGATQQFTATVTNTTNTAVTWEVNGAVGGNATIGTISTSGLYTAPTVLPSTTTVSVTAVSQADTTKSATATVTLTAPPIVISISPTTATLVAGTQQQFTATVSGGSTNVAVWSVNGAGGGNSTVGTVSSTGLYTAPLSPPKESITVTATSQDNAAFTASAPVTVEFGTASLNGHYVLLATQRDNSSGTGFAFRGGTFVADGKGNITGGVTDFNSSAGLAANVAISSGTYTVGADGRGTATIVDANGSHTFAFALTSNARGQLIEFDNAGVTSGYLRLQDQTAIATLSGPFVFSLFGDNAGPFAAVGQLSFTAGNITGTEDVSNLGTPQQIPSITGTYSVGTSGRGTMSLSSILGTTTFAFYIIDTSNVALVDIDSVGVRTSGSAYSQTTTTFSNSSLGSNVYFTSGDVAAGTKPYGQAGRFDTNSAAGQFANGVFDVNNAGVATSNTPFATGNYSVSTTGRGTMFNGTSNFIFYLASTKQGVIMQSDSGIVASGLLLQQQTGITGVTGGFEFVVAGATPNGATLQAIDAQVTTSGLGVLNGTGDMNATGKPVTSTASPAALTGGFALGANGRAVTGNNNNLKLTAPINGAPTIVSSDSYVFYFVSPDRFVLLTSDSGAVLSGIAERQCSDCTF